MVMCIFREEESLIREEDLTSQQYEEYEAGGYSPRLLKTSELEPDTIVYDPEDDIRRLEYARVRLLRMGKAKVSEGEDEVYEQFRNCPKVNATENLTISQHSFR